MMFLLLRLLMEVFQLPFKDILGMRNTDDRKKLAHTLLVSGEDYPEGAQREAPN